MKPARSLESISELSGQTLRYGTDYAIEKFNSALGMLFHVDRFGTQNHIGSAFLLAHDGKLFCVTAAHCIHAVVDGQGLYLRSRGEVLELACRFRVTGAHVANALLDRIDLAVGLLPASLSERLGNLRPFDSRTVDEFRPPIGIHKYLALGFPASKNKPDKLKMKKRSESMGVYCGNGAKGPAGNYKTEYSEKLHCFLEYDQKECLDGSGNSINGFSFVGMSGGLILRIGDYGDLGILAGIKPPVVHPVGVIIEYLKGQKTVVGTRLDLLLEDLDQLF